MKASAAGVALIVAALAAGASLAFAQDDPLGALISGAPIAPAPSEQPPPAPGEVPSAVPDPALVAETTEDVEEVVAEAPEPAVTEPAPDPSARQRYPMAVIQVVDKITAETNRFQIRLDRPAQYKSLIFTLQACETSAPDELTPDSIAHLRVEFQPPVTDRGVKPAAKNLFRGWMYASSPSISPLEHPVYDAWLIACKAA